SVQKKAAQESAALHLGRISPASGGLAAVGEKILEVVFEDAALQMLAGESALQAGAATVVEHVGPAERRARTGGQFQDVSGGFRRGIDHQIQEHPALGHGERGGTVAAEVQDV